MAKMCIRVLTLAVSLLVFLIAGRARAASPVTITLVQVSDTNNTGDTVPMVSDSTTGYGSVSHVYSIGKFDVTLTQYAAFLTAVASSDPYGLYNANMASDANVAGIARTGAFGSYTYSVIGSGSNPVTYVTWLDAARFCNWMQNGQPTTKVEDQTTTEQGAYTLNGDTTGGLEIKNAGATWWVPTEDEWYKAAYYDPSISGTAGYFAFPTESDTLPGNDGLDPTIPNQANFFDGGLYAVTQEAVLSSTQNYLSPVGAFSNSASFYGTFDQGGDVYQWNDAVISGTGRGIRGGAWTTGSNTLLSDDRENAAPTTASPTIGFRVASSTAPPAVITSPLTATASNGAGFTYQITANNSPTSFGASPLPTGLTISSTSGLISGTATVTGTFFPVLSAVASTSTASGTLTLVVQPPVPVITSTLDAFGTDFQPFKYTIVATNSPTSYDASPLPSGLTVTSSSGLISGTPTQTGTFNVALTVSNVTGSGTADLVLVIDALSAPVITSTLSVTVPYDQAFSYQIEADNFPTSYDASGLPPGLTLDGTTGLISGTSTATGTYGASISAINQSGTDTETLDLTVLPPEPVITSTTAASGSNGAAFIYTITASNSPTSFTATNLPPGLTLDGSTGVISGVLAGGGVYPVTIDAINTGGTGSATLTVTVFTNVTQLLGSYQGLAAIDGTNMGLFTATVSGSGSVTGKISIPPDQIPFKGMFNPTLGTFEVIQSSGKATLDILLRLNAAQPGISGSMVQYSEASGLTEFTITSGLLKTYTAATIPAGIAGDYTAALPPVSATNSALPQAPCYGLLRVAPSGAIVISGNLGDGRAFTAHSQLQADGKTWTLFSSLYGGKTPGDLAGTVTFTGTSPTLLSGTVDWVKNAGNPGIYTSGFATRLNLTGAAYSSKALKSGTGTVEFVGGGLVFHSGTSSTAILTGTDTVVISPTQKVVVSGSALSNVAISINPATGTFSGRFPYPTNHQSTPFGGVLVVSGTEIGYGGFVRAAAGDAGSVTIQLP